jgi:DNA-binding SARP family transcriptional activator
VLRARLFGRLELHAADEPIVLPAGRRACELLAWLALNPGEHPRGTLAATFWPDVLDTSARASLRSATWAVRKALAQAGAEDALLPPATASACTAPPTSSASTSSSTRTASTKRWPSTTARCSPTSTRTGCWRHAIATHSA